MLILKNIKLSKSKRFNIRVNQFQYRKVRRKAQQLKIKPSVYIRKLINDDTLNPKDYLELVKYRAQNHEAERQQKQAKDNWSYDIKEIGNNINQIARSLNTELKLGSQIDNQDVNYIKQRLSQILSKIQGGPLYLRETHWLQ